MKIKHFVSEYPAITTMLILTILISLLFIAYPIVVSYSDNLSASTMEDIASGDIEKALKKCQSILMRTSTKSYAPLIEAILFNDSDKAYNTIKNDKCYGKCFHKVNDLKVIAESYSKSNISAQERLNLENLCDNVLDKIKDDYPNYSLSFELVH